MYATNVLIGMTLLRVIAPIVLLLAIGEWARHRALTRMGPR